MRPYLAAAAAAAEQNIGVNSQIATATSSISLSDAAMRPYLAAAAAAAAAEQNINVKPAKT
jgi:hypothetical protein